MIETRSRSKRPDSRPPSGPTCATVPLVAGFWFVLVVAWPKFGWWAVPLAFLAGVLVLFGMVLAYYGRGR